MVLFLSLLITEGDKYILGSTSEGEVHVWLFSDLLLEFLKEKIEKETLFSSICKFSFKDGPIQNLALFEKGIESLFFNDETSIYGYSWPEILDEIKERKNLGQPSTKVTKFKSNPKRLYNILQNNSNENERIQCVDYDHSQNRCFIGTNRGHVLIIDLKEMKLIKRVSPVKNSILLDESVVSINAIRFFQNNSFIYGNSRGNLELYDYEAQKPIKVFKLEKDSLSLVKFIQFEIDQKWVVVGHNDYITRWHVQSGNLDSALPISSDVNYIFPTDDVIYTAHNDNQILNWESNGELLGKFEASAASVTAIAGKVEGKDRILVIGGNSPIIDLYVNSHRIFSYVAN